MIPVPLFDRTELEKPLKSEVSIADELVIAPC